MNASTTTATSSSRLPASRRGPRRRATNSCRQLADHGLIRDDLPIDDAVAIPGATLGVKSADLARANRALQHVLYAVDGPMIRFYRALFGEEVRHFDFTWLRLVKPGMGTASHCDLAFMGRGTHQLCTSWTPLGDIDRTLGGLIVLEGSHRQRDLTDDYLATDVDTVCENRHDGAWLGPDGTRNRPELATGAITEDHVGLRQKFGGRWLTTDYRAGDLLSSSTWCWSTRASTTSRQTACACRQTRDTNEPANPQTNGGSVSTRPLTARSPRARSSVEAPA
jgi:hypothetical protein